MGQGNQGRRTSKPSEARRSIIIRSAESDVAHVIDESRASVRPSDRHFRCPPNLRHSRTQSPLQKRAKRRRSLELQRPRCSQHRKRTTSGPSRLAKRVPTSGQANADTSHSPTCSPASIHPDICGQCIANRFGWRAFRCSSEAFSSSAGRWANSLRDECHALLGVLAVNRHIGCLERHLAKPSPGQDATQALLTREWRSSPVPMDLPGG